MLTSFIFNKRNKDKSLPSFFLPPHEMLFPGQWAISAGAFDMMHFEDVFKTQMLSLELQCFVYLL